MLLSLQQAILIRPERPWMEAFAALLGGALLVLVSGFVENKYIKYVHANRFEISGPGELNLFTVVFRLELINTNMVLGKMLTQ